MELDYYKQYLHYKAVGFRSEARANLQQFIDSFVSITEKEQWTREFLEAGEYGHKIRYELYEEVVFPALLNGYQRKDPWSVLWLARTAQNLYKVKHLHEQIDLKTDFGLLKECYLLDPNNIEIRKDLLNIQVQWLQYCIHEYPTGILYGNDGATTEECQEILSEIGFVREFDTKKIQEELLNDVQSKVLEYRDRSRKR